MRVLISILSFSLFLSIGTAHSRELVVMKAVGSLSYKAGDVLENDDIINIPENSSLLLISSLGKKIKIAGPFSGSFGADEKSNSQLSPQQEPGIGIKLDLVKSLARLFKTQVVDATSLGAFRSLGTSVLSDPWSYDLYKQTSYCFKNTSGLTLWREKIAKAETLTLKSSHDLVQLTWKKGEHSVSWPVDLPPSNGQDYTAILPNGKNISFALHQAPSDLPTRIHTAAWMAENKCDYQAMLLVVNSDIDNMLEGLAQDGKF